MMQEQRSGIQQSGRLISEQQIQQICETVQLFPKLSLGELCATICEHLQWYTPAGGLKEDACEKLLKKLQQAGMVKLPERRRMKTHRPKVAITSRTDAPQSICCSLRELEGVRLQMVKSRAHKRLWNEYVHRYHPLGYKQPFGYRMRYFVDSGGGRLGCVMFAGAAKGLAARDGWIGWTQKQRLQRLPWVINNNRYLVFPWVKVKNLSSHVLGKVAQRVAEDSEAQWGYRPVLMETFVDPEYQGSSYKAAGWQYVGMSTGQGLVREGCRYTTRPKMIFVKPLVEDFRSVLCSELQYQEEQL